MSLLLRFPGPPCLLDPACGGSSSIQTILLEMGFLPNGFYTRVLVQVLQRSRPSWLYVCAEICFKAWADELVGAEKPQVLQGEWAGEAQESRWLRLSLKAGSSHHPSLKAIRWEGFPYREWGRVSFLFYLSLQLIG